ncbi:MAG: iron-only hydrogenase system regulator [Oscillospiraceae bacterium]|nr:iron-only hydrogenase system regulator [Oscillospiraceae bacterium]
METRIAALAILVEDPESVEKLNALLHDYAPFILGRMGIPNRDKGVNVICLVLDAPMDVINALNGKLGRLPGVSAKAVTPKNTK